jgi:hypothetical protein
MQRHVTRSASQKSDGGLAKLSLRRARHTFDHLQSWFFFPHSAVAHSPIELRALGLRQRPTRHNFGIVLFLR